MGKPRGIPGRSTIDCCQFFRKNTIVKFIRKRTNCEVDIFVLEIQFPLRVKEFLKYNFEKLQKKFDDSESTVH